MKEFAIVSKSQKNIGSASLRDMAVAIKFKDLNGGDTDDFFEVEAQPRNTCPFIDDTQKAMDKHIEELEKIIKAGETTLDSLSHPECSFCQNKEIRSRNVQTLKSRIDEAEEGKKTYEKAKDYLEKLRADCENTREEGHIIKNYLWTLISQDLEKPEVLASAYEKLEEFKNLVPLQFSDYEYSHLFSDNKVCSLDVENFDSCEGEDCPFSSLNEEQIFEDVESCLPSEYISEEDYSDAFKNFEKIVAWANLWIDQIKKIISDQEKIKELKEMINKDKFLEVYQNHWDEFYLYVWAKGEYPYIKKDEGKIQEKPEIQACLNFLKDSYEVEFKLLSNLAKELDTSLADILQVDVNTNLELHHQKTNSAFNRLLPQLEAFGDLYRASRLAYNSPYKQYCYDAICELNRHPLLDHKKTIIQPKN